MKKNKDEEVPTAPPEPTEAELIERRKAALAQYGIVDARVVAESESDELPNE